MARGWKTASAGLDLEVGQLLEGSVLDADGRKQGSILIGLKEIGGRTAGETTVKGHYLTASDPSYRWWMESGDGKALEDEGWYHLCGKGDGACVRIRGKPKTIHFTRFRVTDSGEVAAGHPPWALEKGLQKQYKARMAAFRALMKPKEKKGEEKKETSDWGPSPLGDSSDGSGTETEDEDAKAESRKLRDRLSTLRKELREAEKAESERKKKNAEAKKKRKATSAKKGSNKEKLEKKSKKKKKKRGDEKGGESSEKSEGKDVDPGRASGAKKPKKKRKKRRGASAGEEESSRSDGKVAKRRRKAKKRKRSSDSSEERGSSERSGKEGLFTAKGKAGRGEEEPLEGDRGPFGEGPPVQYDDGTSTEESDFQKAPSRTAKSAQLKLLRYSRKYPGRLASRMLLKMQRATARGLEGATKTMTPAVAQNHILTIMVPSLQAKIGIRTQRELKTLGEALDQLALGRPSRTADVIAQRIKALERATQEGGWSSAQFLELLPPESSTLLERDEELYLAKEYLTDQKLKSFHRSPGGGQNSWDRPQKGKGWGKKGESKGEKGKGKGKKNQENKETVA